MENVDWRLIIFIACSLVAVIQIGYYLFVFSRLAFYKDAGKTSDHHQPVTVIVCARDEAANLAKNLPGILVQEFADQHEVIVVNDNSEDETKYLIEALQKDFPQIYLLELKQEAQFIKGKKFPLSMGIKAAKSEAVLLTDADCVPASELWMQKMVAGFDDGKEIVLGYSPYHKQKGMLNKIIRFETFHTALQYLSYALAGLPYMGVGRNLAYKKDIFFRNKGFSAHNHLPGGDDDLLVNASAHKYNTAVVIDKDSFTFSSPKKKWREWKKQKDRHYTTGKYYKTKHRLLLGGYSLTHFLFYPLVIASALLYSWQLALSVFLLRATVQAVVWFKAMNKLGEDDLKSWFLFFDIFMFFYYLIFSPSLWKKARVNWK